MTTPAKFDEYIGYCRNHPNIRGRSTIVTLVAIGAAESGLDNMAVGRNDLNGTPPTSEFHHSLGLGWLQHDSGWLYRDTIVNNVQWTIEEIRRDPVFSLDLLITRPGFVLFQGTNVTYIDFKKWAVYPKKSDQFMDDAEAAYDRWVALG